jgi:hypothetical protein
MDHHGVVLDGRERLRALTDGAVSDLHACQAREKVLAIAHRYETGESLAEIAAALGASKSGVAHALDRAGVELRPWGSRWRPGLAGDRTSAPGWSSLVVLRYAGGVGEASGDDHLLPEREAELVGDSRDLVLTRRARDEFPGHVPNAGSVAAATPPVNIRCGPTPIVLALPGRDATGNHRGAPSARSGATAGRAVLSFGPVVRCAGIRW